MENFNLNGLKINIASLKDLFEIIDNAVSNNKKIVINYINAYSLLLCSKDEAIKNNFKFSDILFQEGTGMYFAGKIFNKKIFRFNLTDCAWEFINFLSIRNYSTLFLGGNNNTLSKLDYNLCGKKLNNIIVGYFNGYEDINNPEKMNNLSGLKGNILLVGMGSHKQEQWINENYSSLNFNIIFSVGDLFNELSGSKSRGPLLLRKAGFEWLTRVIINPKIYYKRYILGIPSFFILLLKLKLKNNLVIK